MMVASIGDITSSTTTSPAKALRPILVELFQVPSKFYLEFATEIIGLFRKTGSPARSLLGTRPRYQLQLSFMLLFLSEFLLPTSTVFIIPVRCSFALSLVRRPV